MVKKKKKKKSAFNAGDPGSTPESGRSPGEENGSPLQYSFLGNSMDRGAWQATVHGVSKESDMTVTKQSTRPFLLFLLQAFRERK